MCQLFLFYYQSLKIKGRWIRILKQNTNLLLPSPTIFTILYNRHISRPEYSQRTLRIYFFLQMYFKYNFDTLFSIVNAASL